MFSQYHPLIPKHLPNPLQSTCHVVSFGCCRVNSPPARRGRPRCGCWGVPWPAGCSAPGSCDMINCEPQRRRGAATAGYGGLWPADRAKGQCRILCGFSTFFFNIKDLSDNDWFSQKWRLINFSLFKNHTVVMYWVVSDFIISLIHRKKID